MSVMNIAQTQMLYGSGPLNSGNSGYKLHQLDMSNVNFDASLTVNNDTAPQLGLIDTGDYDGYAVIGTMTTANYLKLVLVYFG